VGHGIEPVHVCSALQEILDVKVYQKNYQLVTIRLDFFVSCGKSSHASHTIHILLRITKKKLHIIGLRNGSIFTENFGFIRKGIRNESVSNKSREM